MASILKVDTIQDQDGNNIINESANTITIGASGDTITIPSGATLANSGIVTGFESTGIDDNATSTAITIDSNEVVRIGNTSDTYSPTYTEHMVIGNYNADEDHGITFLSDLDNTFTLGFADDGHSTLRGAIKYSHLNDFMTFHAFADAERMRITKTGNVGIGTSSPAHNVEIVATASGSINDTLQIRNNSGDTGSGSRIRFITSNDSNSDTNGASLGTVRSGNDNAMFFETENVERMRIDTNGKVGIGETSMDALLVIKGNSDENTTPSIRLKDGSDTREAWITNNAGDLILTTGGNDNVPHTQIKLFDGNFMTFRTANTERMRIDSSGNVGIGTSSPAAQLHVYNYSGSTGFRVTRGNNITGVNMHMSTNSANNYFEGYGNLFLSCSATGTGTGASERLGISTSGDISSNSGNITGSFSRQNVGITYRRSNAFVCTRSGGQPLEVNRTSNDGQLVTFFQNDTEEGNISVSGNTVSYNGFTGTHWSRFTDNSTPTILRGTVLETLDEMCDWYNLEFDVITQDEDGNDITSPQKIPHVLANGQSDGDVITYNHEGTDYQATIVKEADIKHMKSKVSDTVDAKNVYGVFVAYDEDGEGYNDFYVASVGSYVVRIKANETIAKGDLLQSNGDGTAKVQTDDAVRSSSFAKVLSTTIIETYEDGSYLVPCSLMC